MKPNRRRLKVERLESRRLMSADLNSADVNNDREITASDALLVINRLEHAEYSEQFDVNKDGRITARDALNVVNRIGETLPPILTTPWDKLNAMDVERPGARVFTISVGGRLDTFGLTEDQILTAISDAVKAYENVGNVDVRFVQSGGQYNLSSQELYLGNGVHARGQVFPGVGGSSIRFHNGIVAPFHHNPASTGTPANQTFYWKVMSSPQALKQIVMHEVGHAVFRFVHHPSVSCVMNINAATDQFCGVERSTLISRFGASRIQG